MTSSNSTQIYTDSAYQAHEVGFMWSCYGYKFLI